MARSSKLLVHSRHRRQRHKARKKKLPPPRPLLGVADPSYRIKSKVSAEWPLYTETRRFQVIAAQYFRHQLILNVEGLG